MGMVTNMNVSIRRFNGIKNLYNNRVLIFIYLFILLPPYIVNHYEFLDLIINILRIIVSIVIITDYFLRGKMSRFFLLEASIWVAYIIYCLLNHTYEYHILVTVASILSLTALIESCFIKNKENHFYKGLQLLLITYLLANFATLMMTDLDLLRVTSVDSELTAGLFLGFDNDAAMELIPLMGVLLCLGGKKKNFIIFILAFLEFMMTACASGIIVFFILLIYYFVCNHVELPRWMKSWTILLLFGIVFISIYLFKIQNLLSFLIVDILGKDLTLSYRTTIWKYTLEAIKNSWLIGYGNFAYSQLYASQVIMLAPHNIFLYFLLMGGFLGLVLFVFIIIYSFKTIDNNPKYMDMNSALIVALFCYLLCGVVASYYALENLSVLLCVANQASSNNYPSKRLGCKY